MLPPLYLLLLLWPTCPLVPPRHRTIRPINPKPGTYWLRRQALLDPMREPLHIRHLPRVPRRALMIGGMPSLAHVGMMARMSVDMAAEGTDRTVLAMVRGGSAVSADPVVARAILDEASHLKRRSMAKSAWMFQPARPVQHYKTPSNHQKPWQRPRGLSSAARRRQNTNRKGRK